MRIHVSPLVVGTFKGIAEGEGEGLIGKDMDRYNIL